jgi:hypothetical protein
MIYSNSIHSNPEVRSCNQTTPKGNNREVKFHQENTNNKEVKFCDRGVSGHGEYLKNGYGSALILKRQKFRGLSTVVASKLQVSISIQSKKIYNQLARQKN